MLNNLKQIFNTNIIKFQTKLTNRTLISTKSPLKKKIYSTKSPYAKIITKTTLFSQKIVLNNKIKKLNTSKKTQITC